MYDATKRLLDLPTIAGEIKEAIEIETAKAPEGDGPRTYLGASTIGHECKAALWFSFRWITPPEALSGRMRRLFERGHLEELRINKWLEMTGWNVQALDPNTGKQWRFLAVDGHFGGSCDKQMTNPRWSELGNVLGEDKTHGSKSFIEVLNKGVQLSKPMHVAQMNCYGAYFKNDYGLYFPVNKNDDDIKPELLEVDVNEARKLTMKAEEVISAIERPRRCSETPTYFTCRYCSHAAACHNKEPALKSCRACRFGVPAANSTWTCGHWGGTIPEDFMPVGCDAFQQVSY